MVISTYVAGFAMLLFCVGIFMFLSRATLVGMLLGIEMMLNAALLNFIVFAQFSHEPMQGQLMALFILAIAAGEAALALAMWRKAVQVAG